MVEAVHLVSKVTVDDAGIRFQIKSFSIENQDMPFKSIDYHCDYRRDVELYRQCYEYLVGLDDFSGAVIQE